MDVRWRLAVPESSNEKCFRSTQRAVEKRGAIAWDISYWSHILVSGDVELVQKVLEEVCKDAAADKKADCTRDSDLAPGGGRGGEGAQSGFYTVWEELLAAMRAPNIAAGEQRVFIDDLRFELGSIQIAGPSATDALLFVLNPATPPAKQKKHGPVSEDSPTPMHSRQT
ncbi:hypothetical protein FN846DRAFT_906097 [Sphaerosporella brunnea]|uniref:Pop1 N-terminal domain-containing protein n=1 Tax=Sphaerosporella brunnea TaxID=1250544 RepID=A0A5J5EZC3_9PEZI|nr:hypothetical protein FN846DRAFT_906097 [Sphaerosporella brunnea]